MGLKEKLAYIIIGLMMVLGWWFYKESTVERNEVIPTEVRLVVWGIFDESEIYRGVIESYQSAHPNVKIKYYKIGNETKEYEDLLLNEIAEGEGPDIFLIKNTWLEKHKGKIAPLELDEVAALKLEDFAQVVKQDFFEEAGNEITKVWALPLYVDDLALYYNRTQFAQDVPSRGKPGTTWSEIAEDVVKLTRKDNSAERFKTAGIALGRMDNITRGGEVLVLLMSQMGTRFYNQAGTASLLAEVQNAQGQKPGVEAINFFTSFADTGARTYTWNELMTHNQAEGELYAFARGKVAMITGYSYTYAQIQDAILNCQKAGGNCINLTEVGVSEMPQINVDAPETYASYFAFTVSRNSKNQAEAWKFIEAMITEDNLREYHRETHKPAPLLSLLEEQMSEAIYGVFAKQVEYAKSYELVDEETFFALLKENVTKVNEGRLSVLEAAQNIQTGVTEKMEEIRILQNLSTTSEN